MATDQITSVRLSDLSSTPVVQMNARTKVAVPNVFRHRTPTVVDLAAADIPFMPAAAPRHRQALTTFRVDVLSTDNVMYPRNHLI